MGVPRLTQARAPLTQAIEAVNEYGDVETVSIPAERALTVYVDKRELVTLMTLGAQPELLVLGYLRNQRLVQSVSDIDSITVDWEVGAAAVKTCSGIDQIEERTARRVVTTGCALFQGQDMLVFVEDVGRHNAIDTIAGWMWMQDAAQTTDALRMQGTDKVFYTTGRLTSEMVIKSAQMGVPIVVSRSGITQMGHAVAQQLGLCAIGRATNRHFVCYSGRDRLLLQPELAGPRRTPVEPVPASTSSKP